MKKILVTALEDGKIGPLLGPFTFALDQSDGNDTIKDEETLEILASFVARVASGVSAYNKNDMEASSNLKSYALECFDDLKMEFPGLAALIEGLCIDCSPLPASIKEHPIFRLDRAIMRTLPRVRFID